MKQQYAVIFDMGDILFEVDRWGMSKELGHLNILKYIYHEGTLPDNKLLAQLFEIMYHFGKQENGNNLIATHETIELPQLSLEWLKGKLHSSKLLEQVKEHLSKMRDEGKCKHYDLLVKLAHVIHNPELIAKHIKPIKPAWDLVKKCKEQRVIVCILSNLDPETFALLQKRFGNLFQAYFDEIIISGHVKLAKPDPAIYELLLDLLKKDYAIDPDDCWFIDDAPDNIAAAQQVGIHGLLCKGQCKGKSLNEINKILNEQLFSQLI